MPRRPVQFPKLPGVPNVAPGYLQQAAANRAAAQRQVTGALFDAGRDILGAGLKEAFRDDLAEMAEKGMADLSQFYVQDSAYINSPDFREDALGNALKAEGYHEAEGEEKKNIYASVQRRVGTEAGRSGLHRNMNPLTASGVGPDGRLIVPLGWKPKSKRHAGMAAGNYTRKQARHQLSERRKFRSEMDVAQHNRKTVNDAEEFDLKTMAMHSNGSPRISPHDGMTMMISGNMLVELKKAGGFDELAPDHRALMESLLRMHHTQVERYGRVGAYFNIVTELDDTKLAILKAGEANYGKALTKINVPVVNKHNARVKAGRKMRSPWTHVLGVMNVSEREGIRSYSLGESTKEVFMPMTNWNPLIKKARAGGALDALVQGEDGKWAIGKLTFTSKEVGALDMSNRLYSQYKRAFDSGDYKRASELKGQIEDIWTGTLMGDAGSTAHKKLQQIYYHQSHPPGKGGSGGGGGGEGAEALKAARKRRADFMGTTFVKWTTNFYETATGDIGLPVVDGKKSIAMKSGIALPLEGLNLLFKVTGRGATLGNKMKAKHKALVDLHGKGPVNAVSQWLTAVYQNHTIKLDAAAAPTARKRARIEKRLLKPSRMKKLREEASKYWRGAPVIEDESNSLPEEKRWEKIQFSIKKTRVTTGRAHSPLRRIFS